MSDEFVGRVYLQGDMTQPIAVTFWLQGAEAYCRIDAIDYAVDILSGTVSDRGVIAGTTYRRLIKIVRKARDKKLEATV